METGIEVVCLDDPGEPFLKGIHCPVHALGQSFLGRYAFSPRLWHWLHANLDRFDGIVMNGVWTFPSLAIRIAARRAHRPYGIFAHGALDPWFNRKYPLKHLKKMLYWPVQYSVLRDAQAVFFTTEIERDLARESFRPNRWHSEVIPLGITDPEATKENASDQVEAFYAKLPMLRGRRFLLFLARIHEKKGCDLLIEAFGKVAASVPEVDLVIAGPGQHGTLAKLTSLAEQVGISGRVHWPGLVGGDVKWGALRACEVFILPSHQENFGIAVIESLAVGCPVLVSNQVNIWQQIADDRVGLVDDDTLEGTERLLRGWFGLRARECEEMRTRARASFMSRYRMNRVVAAINAQFLSAVPGN
jgi:glycosyltransferase involved in cell wall biosynthesis